MGSSIRQIAQTQQEDHSRVVALRNPNMSFQHGNDVIYPPESLAQMSRLQPVGVLSLADSD